jgi:hypothetical protein
MSIGITAPALRGLRQIPGVGKVIARDLRALGIQSMNDLVDQDPEKLYRALCELQGQQIDRCMLYVFRCAVYYATKEANHEQADPELLKWWNWKDHVAG